jgi:hypothetical protein
VSGRTSFSMAEYGNRLRTLIGRERAER